MLKAVCFKFFFQKNSGNIGPYPEIVRKTFLELHSQNIMEKI